VTTLVVGAGGQLGHDLAAAFADTSVTALARDELDVTDAGRIGEVVAAVAPDVVLNAAAWTDVDACEDDPERAWRINAAGPWHLAQACAKHGATLVTVSTDYVFGSVPAPSGATVHDARRGYRETDTTHPGNAYGRSKLAGERLVRATTPHHHIVRTAWLSGAHGANIVRTILRLGREREQLRFVDDQIGSPTTTADLAAAIRRLVASGRTGTVHLTNAGRASWYDLAAAVVELAGLPTEVVARATEPGERPAARPAWSVLDGGRAAAIGVGPLPHWRAGLRDLLAELGELAGPEPDGDARVASDPAASAGGT
jgi:dTDP-4-dehydrorhamnose reductase